MASIWRHPNSKYWTACFTDETGRQVKRSTKRVDRGEALKLAMEYEHAARLTRDGVLTEAKCREILSGMLERTTGSAIRHTTARAYLEEWLEGKCASKSEGTAERYSHTLRLFLKHLGDRADRPLIAVAPGDIQSFLTARLKEGSAPKTAIVDVKALNNAFNQAKRQGLIPTNPVEAVELPSLESSERGVFKPEEVQLLVEAAPTTEWKTLILLAYYTGARLGDCAHMKWEHVDLTGEVIRFAPQKTKRTRKLRLLEIPIHAELLAHLNVIAATDQARVFLCPELATKGGGGQHGLSEAFKSLVRKAGLEQQTVQGTGNRMFNKLTFHSLRHSFNSALANAGVPQELRMKLTGHTTAATNTTYTHHELAALRNAIGKLPTLSGPPEQPPKPKGAGDKTSRRGK